MFKCVQATPEPVYPRLHAQENDPNKFEHVAVSTSQLCTPSWHSSRSTQTWLSLSPLAATLAAAAGRRTNPAEEQEHEKEPGVFVHREEVPEQL